MLWRRLFCRQVAKYFQRDIAMSTHFSTDELLANPVRVETGLQDGARFTVSISEAMALRQQLRGAIWTPETIRLTTDVARVIYQGGAMTAQLADLQGFGASLVFDGKAMPQSVVSTATVVLLISAAAVIGYAIGHLDTTPQPDLVLEVQQAGGCISIAIA